MGNPEDVQIQVTKLLGDDPTLTDASRIISSTKQVGRLFKKRIQVTLEGKVASEGERHKAEQIIHSHYHDAVQVDNRIVVGR